MVEVPLFGPLVARMIAVPSASAVTSPVALTVAMSGVHDGLKLHRTVEGPINRIVVEDGLTTT